MKQCHVKIYRQNDIDRLVSPVPFTPGVFFKKDVKSKSRNVATKKTAGTSSHMFDMERHCTRTQGVSSYFLQRNLMCKLRTKDLMMYSAKPHGLDVNDAFHNPNVNCAFVKEDLQLDVGGSDENESDWLERIPIEKESGPSIDFICSLPPELFEKQDSTEIEMSCANSQDVVSEPLKKKTERIVYASLPTTETECKWWVVEMDSKKFSNLIYYSDKRCLYIDDMMRATFKAEFGKKTVCIPLNKPHSIHRDKFGAYAVPGHKYLMFFGPYELGETHGLTAIKMINGDDMFCRVFFSSTFSSSEGFKSLGITMPNTAEDSPVSAKCVKAVWWYSTGKKSSSLQDKTQRTVETTRNTSGSSEPLCVPTASTGRSEEVLCNPSEDGNGDTTEAFNQTATLEYDEIQTIKTEEMIKDEIVILDDMMGEEPTVDDIFGDDSMEMPLEESNYVDNRLMIDETNTDDIEMKPSTPVMEENVTTDIAVPQEPIEQPKTANRKIQLLLANKKPKQTKKKFKRKKQNFNFKTTTPFKHSSNILRLQEKIAVLNAAIGMKNEKPSKIQEAMSLTADSDSSSSFSDDDFYKEINAEGSMPSKSLDVANINRIIHLPIKIPRSSEQEKKEGSLNNLMQKTPSTEPCPERALLCLTPGVGYLPIVEFDHKKLVIQDPANLSLEHQFQDHKQASLWLNDYFKKVFTFNVNFDMEWWQVKGGLIKYLLPLSRSLFTFRAKELEITPTGLEPPLVMRQELRNQLERERRTEVSRLLQNLSQEVLPPDTSKTPVQIVLKSANYMIRVQTVISKELDTEYDDLMTQQSHLTDRLRELLTESEENKKELKIAAILKDTKKKSFKENMKEVYMKAMRDLELNMVKSLEGFTRTRHLNFQAELQNTETDAMNINCNETASQLSIEHPLQSQSANPIRKRKLKKTKNNSESPEIIKAIPTEGMLIKRKKVNQEISLVGTSSDKRAVPSTFDKKAVSSASDKKVESSTSDEIAVSSKSDKIAVSSTFDKIAGPSTFDKIAGPSTFDKIAGPSTFDKIAVSSAPDKDVSSSNEGTSCDVIDLIDSDEDKNQVIEIDSEEEDVVWIPDQQPRRDRADLDDVEVVPHSRPAILRKQPRFFYPRKKPVSGIKTVRPSAFINLSDTVEEAFSSGPSCDQDVSGTITLSDVEIGSDDSQPTANQVSGQACLREPEFVPVADAYKPVSAEETEDYSLFSSGCSRTDPVRLNPSWCRRSVSSAAALRPRPTPQAQQPEPHTKLVTCKSVTPIGKLPLKRAVLNKFKGKRIMLFRSHSGFKMAKLSASNPSLYRNVPQWTSVLKPSVRNSSDTAEPVAVDCNQSVKGSTKGPVDSCPSAVSPDHDRLELKASPEVAGAAGTPPTPVSPNQAEMVTLYHPSQELSDTRTVQFSPMNSVHVESPSLSGPKIRRPKPFASLRVMLPKRN